MGLKDFLSSVLINKRHTPRRYGEEIVCICGKQTFIVEEFRFTKYL